MPRVNKVMEPHDKQMKLTAFFKDKSCKSVGLTKHNRRVKFWFIILVFYVLYILSIFLYCVYIGHYMYFFYIHILFLQMSFSYNV